MAGFFLGDRVAPVLTHFIVCRCDYSSDGGDARTRQMALFTPRLQTNKNLFFPEVGKLFSQSSYFFQDFGMPLLCATYQWTFAAWDKRFRASSIK